MIRCPNSKEAPPTRWGPILSLLVTITTRTFDIFGDHEDHEDPANNDDDYTTARLVSSLERWRNIRKIMGILLMMIMISILKSISLPRWFPAWKDEGGGAVEASRPEDRAPGDVLSSILYFFGNLSPRWDRIIWIPSFSLFCWKSR